MRYYHGSDRHGLTKVLSPFDDPNVMFYGMFFNDLSIAQSHEHGALYVANFDDDGDDLLEASQIPWDDDAYALIQTDFGAPLEDEELFCDLIGNTKSVFSAFDDISPSERDALSESLGHATGWYPASSDPTELDFAFQNAACYVAQKLGYRGVLVPDEHGTSIMAVPGTAIRELILKKEKPVAKNLAR